MSLSSSKQDPPGEGRKAEPGSGGLGCLLHLRKEGTHLFAFMALRGSALTVPTLKRLPNSQPHIRHKGKPPRTRAFTEPCSALGEPKCPEGSLCQARHTSPACLFPSLCGVPPSLPGSSVLLQTCQGTELTGRLFPLHLTKITVLPTKYLDIGGAI